MDREQRKGKTFQEWLARGHSVARRTRAKHRGLVDPSSSANQSTPASSLAIKKAGCTNLSDDLDGSRVASGHRLRVATASRIPQHERLADIMDLQTPFKVMEDNLSRRKHHGSQKRKREATPSHLGSVSTSPEQNGRAKGKAAGMLPYSNNAPISSVLGPNSSTSSTVSPEPEFHRRLRHKTRDDRYEYKGNRRKERLKEDLEVKKERRRKRHKKVNAGDTVFDKFTANNIAIGRLTASKPDEQLRKQLTWLPR